MQIKKHLALLGFRAEDKVTGYKGVISNISFDLYGCVQTVLSPPVDKDGKKTSGEWFDIARLKITSKKPVMDVPDFDFGAQAEGKQGASEKPMCSKY